MMAAAALCSIVLVTARAAADFPRAPAATTAPTTVPTSIQTSQPPSPTPTATPPASGRCVGDCDGNGMISINELIIAVNIALGILPLSQCLGFESSSDGTVSISQLIAAVSTLLEGCPATPTPTATTPATLEEIQRTIFSPRCAIPGCHDTSGQYGDLTLDADHAYAQLVGVPPSNGTASVAGLLRVDPGHPENSFLLIKLNGPPKDEGVRMPATGAPLTPAQIQLIHDWIADGAAP